MSWHLMPIEVSKKLPTMLAMARRPIYLRGFLNMQCTHIFFQAVNNTHYLYTLFIKNIPHIFHSY